MFHLSTGIGYRLEQAIHLARNMFFYHFLITAELGSMIPPDTLVPISCIVFIERVRSQVQDTIIQRLVLQNHLVGLGLLKTLCLYLFVHKLVVIKVTLVHVPHIYQTKYCQGTYQNRLLQLAHAIRPHQSGTYQDDEETAPSIGSEQGHAHLFQIGKQRHQLVGRDALQSIHFHGRYIRREEQLRQYGKQKRQSTRQPEANQKILLAFLDYIRDSHHLLQCQHGQQRNSKLGYHEDGRHRTELVVHRHIVDEQVSKSHEILTPRKQDGKDSSCQKCPFHRAFHDEQAQDEKEHHESTHIHRS